MKICNFDVKKPNRLYIKYNYKNIFINSKYISKGMVLLRGNNFTREYHYYPINNLINKKLSCGAISFYERKQ
jgi:hypothetical protein